MHGRLTNRPGVRQRSRPQQPGTAMPLITRRAGLSLSLGGGAALLAARLRARVDVRAMLEAALARRNERAAGTL